MAISTVVHAQHRAPVVPFIDTIQYENTILIQSSMYSGAIPIPYEGANPKEVYRAAKSGKKLVITKDSLLFNLHSMQTVIEYRYENNSWKSLTTVTDVGIQKSSIYFLSIYLCFLVGGFVYCKFKKIDDTLMPGYLIFSMCFFGISLIGSLCILAVLGKYMNISEIKLDNAFNWSHVGLMLISSFLLPYIAQIKIRKNKKDTIVEPSPQ